MTIKEFNDFVKENELDENCEIRVIADTQDAYIKARVVDADYNADDGMVELAVLD